MTKPKSSSLNTNRESLKSNTGKVTGGHQPGRVTTTGTGERKIPVQPPKKG